MGEWKKETLFQKLTEYGNLVLLSDCEAHPLVVAEAFSAGLGVVLSEWATANLDLNRKFISVVPEDMIYNTKYIEHKITQNREYSIHNRQEILDYAKEFEWTRILTDYYLPNIEKVIDGKIK